MPKPKALDVTRVLPPLRPGTLTVDEARAILLVGLYATEADGAIADEEQAVFSSLASALQQLSSPNDAKVSDAALDAMIEEATADLDEHGRDPGLARAAKDLGREVARQLAYKVAIVVGLADMSEKRAEVELDHELAALLGISKDDAATLATDVYTSLDAGG